MQLLQGLGVNGFCIRPELLEGNQVPPKTIDTITQLKDVRRLCGRIDWLRLDAGFASIDTLDELDDFSSFANSTTKIKYIINVGLRPKGAMDAKKTANCRAWRSLGNGVYFQDLKQRKVYKDDVKERRMILLKHYAKQYGKWKHYALVTNDEKTNAFDLCYFYHQRQCIEHFFDEAKNNYSIEKLPCQKLLANSLYFNIVAFVFNLLVFFREDVLCKNDKNIRLATLQRLYLNVYIRFDGTTLFIPRHLPNYRSFAYILCRLQKFDILLSYQFC